MNKHLLVLVISLSFISSKAQSKIDTIPKQVKIQDEFIYMRKCLKKAHKQYSDGLVISLTGLTMAAGFSLYKDPNKRVFFTYLGSGLMLTGSIIMIDSNKWLGRAGIGIGGSGVNVKYVF